MLAKFGFNNVQFLCEGEYEATDARKQLMNYLKKLL